MLCGGTFPEDEQHGADPRSGGWPFGLISQQSAALIKAPAFRFSSGSGFGRADHDADGNVENPF